MKLVQDCTESVEPEILVVCFFFSVAHRLLFLSTFVPTLMSQTELGFFKRALSQLPTQAHHPSTCHPCLKDGGPLPSPSSPCIWFITRFLVQMHPFLSVPLTLARSPLT